MATLNTLRTKFGVVLSIIIGLALLAFILSLKTDMGFSNNDPKVGEIGGDKITYTEYYDEYRAVEQQYGGSISDEQQADMIANAAWQNLFMKHVMTPGLENMGITVSDDERMSIVSGEHPSQALYSALVNPETGVYDPSLVYDIIDRAETDPNMAAMWMQVMEQVKAERAMQKYVGLTRAGAYVNSLEVANGVKAANNICSGRFVSAKYMSVPDSLVTVDKNDMKKYYDAHKAQFRQVPNRKISYVVFDIDATSDDMLAIENEVATVGEEFAVTSDIRGFVRQNRHGSIAEGYVKFSQLPDDEAAALAAGKQYGPELKNNVWTISRVVDKKMAPDSLGIRHIVLPYNQEALADSLLTALRGGADFAAAAAEYSVAATGQNGGEVGVLPFSVFSGEFVNALAGAKSGDIVKIMAGDAVQLIQVYRADKPVEFVQVATIAYPVEASAATIREIHTAASTFAIDAKGSVAKFNEAAAAQAYTPREATINQGDRAIRGIDNSRDIIRWASGAKKGEISEIFKAGDSYVVAMLTDIDDEQYTSLEKVAMRIRPIVVNGKKFEYLAAKVNGSSIDEVAASLGSEVETFANVKFSSNFDSGNAIGFEPDVLGAIGMTSQTGVVSAPVRGNMGLYVFVVDEIATAENQQTTDAEKVRAQASAEDAAVQSALSAIQQMAEVEDLRGKYF